MARISLSCVVSISFSGTGRPQSENAVLFIYYICMIDNIHIYIEKTWLYKQSFIYIYRASILMIPNVDLHIYAIVEIIRRNHPQKCIFEELIFRVRLCSNEETKRRSLFSTINRSCIDLKFRQLLDMPIPTE